MRFYHDPISHLQVWGTDRLSRGKLEGIRGLTSLYNSLKILCDLKDRTSNVSVKVLIKPVLVFPLVNLRQSLGGCMSNWIGVPHETLKPTPMVELAETPPLIHPSGLDLRTESGELALCSTVCVRLDLEDLPCFTTVDCQYESWGVLFKNAIAIRPSNPAFPPRSGMMVLLGAPESGWLEVTFLRPVEYVSSFITSSRRIVMRAFNGCGHLVAETESTTANLASDDANLRLSLNGSNISRITLHCFNGQFTLDDFCFCG